MREAEERTQEDESHLLSFGDLRPHLSHSIVTDWERDRFRNSKFFLDTPLDAADALLGR